MSLYKTVVTQVGGSFSLKVIGLGLTFLTSIVLARALGPAAFGNYSFYMALVALVTIPSAGGLPQFMVRKIAEYNAKDSYALLLGLIKRANQIVFVLAAAIAFLIVLASMAWRAFDGSASSEEEDSFLLAIAMGAVPITALIQLRASILRGYRMPVLGQMAELLVKPAAFLALAVFFFLFVTPTASLGLGLQLVAAAIALVFGEILIRNRLAPLSSLDVNPEYKTRYWVRSAVPFLFLGGAQVLMKQTDLVMLGALDAAESVGVYKVAVTGALLVTFLHVAVNQVQGPHISHLWTIGEHQQLQRLVTFNARLTMLATIFSVSALMFLAEWGIELLYGEQYSSAALPLRILCFGHLVNGLSGPVGSILNMTGHEKKAAITVVICCAINVMLNMLLIPEFGIGGAAVATASTLALWNIALLVLVRKFTGLKATALGFI